MIFRLRLKNFEISREIFDKNDKTGLHMSRESFCGKKTFFGDKLIFYFIFGLRAKNLQTFGRKSAT